MKSKISLFTRSLIMSNIKRFWWVSALYFVGLTILFPSRLIRIMVYASLNSGYHYYISVLASLGDMHAIFLWIVPILVGVLLFQYIHQSKAVSMLHALPSSRTNLFINQFISGLILMFVPVILNGIILIILNLSTTLKEAFTIPQVLIVTGLIMLFEILIFSSTTFIGMLTGNSLAHFIFTYIFHLIPIAIYYTITGFLSNMLIGSTNFNNTIFDNVILGTPLLKGLTLYDVYLPLESSNIATTQPVSQLLNLIVNFTTIQLVTYICATLLFISAAILLYKKRNLETATDIISFNTIRPIFKYGITFTIMVIGSIFIMGILNIKPNIPFIVIWSFIGYSVTEMLLKKSLKIWRSYKGFLIYTAIVVAFFIIISKDLFGFVNKVPNMNDIESVYFGTKITWDLQHDKTQYNHVAFSLTYTGTTFKESKNIEYVESIQKQLIDENRNYLVGPKTLNSLNYTPRLFDTPQLFIELSYYDESEFYIIYTMKNGSQLVRGYNSNYVNNFRMGTIDVHPLMVSPEYKINNYPVFSQNIDDIQVISYNNVEITEKDQIAEFVTSLKEDIQTSIDNLINVNGSNSLLITISGRDKFNTKTYANITKDGKTAKWIADHIK